MKLFSFPILNNSFESIIADLAPMAYTFILDGHDPNHALSKFSFIGYDPVKIFIPKPENFLHLKESLNDFHPENRDEFVSIPFCGGLIGLIHYDAGYYFNDMNVPFAIDNNPIIFGLYNKIIYKNLETHETFFLINSKDSEDAQKEFDKFNSSLSSRKIHPNPAIALKPLTTNDEYIKKIEKVISYIKAGDIFQANLSQRFEAVCPDEFNSIAHYLKMRTLNSSPFSSYLNCKDYIISSASPEQFISLCNKKLETSPIKGTLNDHYPKENLETNPKERAENIMIVDLMRNDFSKICGDDSVIVDSLCQIETFKNLHHMISKISGTIKPYYDIFDVLSNIFPGGSITGAPKIRAMEIIAELEGEKRHIYCGSIGYIDYNGNAHFNIAIRSLIITKDKISLSVGSGITAQSIPIQEYEETMIKAKAIIESLS